MPSQIENEVIHAAVEYLNENAGKHRRARWHVDVRRDTQKKTSAFVGSLKSEDKEALDEKLSFIGHHLIGGKLDPIVEATNESAPIATIDYAFERDGAEWKQNGFVHTVKDREALDTDRAELDGRLREALLSKVCDGWTSVRLQYTWNKPLRLARMVNKKPEQLPPEGPVNDAMAGYHQFFAARGLELQTMTAEIESKPKGAFELTLSYGVPHAESA